MTRKNVYGVLIIFVVATLMLFGCGGGRTGGIEGTMTGAESGTPIANAQVILCKGIAEESGCELLAEPTATTDADGKFSFSGLEPSSYLLLYGMLFEDTLKGMVSGAILQDRKLHSKIYSTIDGGKNWREWQDPPHAMILNLERSPEGHTWGSGDNIIVKLDDGNWKTMFQDSTRATGQVRDLLFINRDTILGVSFNGRIIKSYDGGTSWTSSTITSNRLRTTGKVDNNSILVAGDNNKEQGNIFLSQNAGVSWILLDSELEDIHRIAVSGPQCWLVGKNGMIIKLNL